MSSGTRIAAIMVLSLGAIAAGLVQRDAGPTDVVAVVNGESLTAQAVLDAAGTVPDPLTDEWIDAALERAILDALFFQRAQELRLVQRDSVLRGRVMQILREVAEEEATLAPIEEADVRALYDEDPARFSTSASVRFDEIYVQEAGSVVPERLTKAHARLRAGESFDAVREAVGDPPPYAFPEGAAPMHAVRRRYGKTVAAVLLTTPVGALSEPVRGPSGFHVVRVVERDDPRPRGFEEVRDQLETQLREQRRRLSVMEWTQQLRREADVDVSPSARALLTGATTP